MNRKELEAKVEELEKANEILSSNLETAMKQLAESKNGISGTQPANKQAKAPREKDAFGNHVGTQGYMLNSFIIPLVEKGQYDKIKPETLHKMSGGAVPKARWADHLGWLRRKNFL